jgi:hypothetical protein
MALRLQSHLLGCISVILAITACSSPRSASTEPVDAKTSTVPAPIQAPAAAPEVAPTPVTVVPSDRVAPKKSKKLLDPAIQKALATVDPMRVYDTAKAGENVPALVIVGPSDQRIQPLGSAEVAVRGAPESLVTFASSDGGVFSNQEASITVLSDEEGVARTTVHAPVGTIDDVPVRIGSPAASGTVIALVHVLYPDSAFSGTATP